MSASNLPTFSIYQIYYRPEQRRRLDPALIPYENFENERPEWREFHIFRKEWLRGTMDKHDYTGFFSWKFRQKARVQAQAVIDFARANPGADAYFINPFPDMVAYYPNVWIQGDTYHPGLTAATERILEQVGTPRRLAATVHTSDVACYCNYWFANKAFWQAYMAFCLPIYDYVEHRATAEEKAVLWARADRTIDAPLVPYMFERLFTETIIARPDLKVLGFKYSEKHLMRRFRAHFPSLYRGSDELKRVLGRNPDLDLLAAMRAYALVAKRLIKRGRRTDRWTTVRGLREMCSELTGRNPPTIKP